MLKYNFITVKRNDINDFIPFLNIDYASIKGYHKHMLLNEELNNISTSETLKEIVENLEKVELGEIDEYDFGFEITGIHCYHEGKSYYGKKYPKTQVSISYEYGDKHISTDLKIKDILQMMTDWRDYVLNWEKKTGKIKK